MTKQKKRILWQVVLTAIVIAVIVFGGRIERGYYTIASEPFVLAVSAFLIWADNRENLFKHIDK